MRYFNICLRSVKAKAKKVKILEFERSYKKISLELRLKYLILLERKGHPSIVINFNKKRLLFAEIGLLLYVFIKIM